MNEKCMIELKEYLLSSNQILIVKLDNDSTIERMSPALKLALDMKKNVVGMKWDNLFESISIIDEFTSQIRTYNYINEQEARSFKGHQIFSDNCSLVIMEDMKITESDIIEQMTNMNIDMSNMSRIVAKKNRELNNANEKITMLSNHDFLTGIYNRRYFMMRLEEEISMCHRENNYTLGMISFDIDDFKKVNDTYGHDIGDEVLSGIAKATSAILRTHDIFARMGGEEFSILIRCGATSNIVDIAKKICLCCSDIKWKVVGLSKVTISVGATKNIIEDDSSSLLKRCDMLMYQAKSEGKNRVCYE